MIKHKQVSLAGQIFDTLEKEILSGNLERGSVYTETDIANMLGVSRTPVREAVGRLIQENMVEDTNKGLKILGISPEDAVTIYKIRERLEGMVAREAAVGITDEMLKEMREGINYHEYCLTKGDYDKAYECDNDFHEILYRASGNTVLYNTLLPLHRKIQKYRRIAVNDMKRANKSHQEHKEIFAALEKHDADLAEKAITKHIGNARANAEKRLKEAKNNGI